MGNVMVSSLGICTSMGNRGSSIEQGMGSSGIAMGI